MQKKKLPENKRPVLTTVVFPDGYSYVGVSYYDKDLECWRDYVTDFNEPNRVVAWQELPKPYAVSTKKAVAELENQVQEQQSKRLAEDSKVIQMLTEISDKLTAMEEEK